MRPRILVTGGEGQLGVALRQVLAGEDALFTDIGDLDVTDDAAVAQVFDSFRPTWLLHGGAMTNVDGCEDNPRLAWKVNTEGTGYLAEACDRTGCRMVFISTDYVFPGTSPAPYSEQDPPEPLSVYGRTKLEGERRALSLPGAYVLRTSWVYGKGKNFVKTMLALSKKTPEVRVVSDQRGRPTYALDLARAMLDLMSKRPEGGIYNVTGDGAVISWAEFARTIFELTCVETKVTEITTREYLAQFPDRKIAPRPANSALCLEKSRNAGLRLRDWREALTEYLASERG